jgi:hypothetical protein
MDGFPLARIFPPNVLDRRPHFPNIGGSMGKHDNRTSMKMRRRKAQRKLKARLHRQKSERQAARAPGKPAKKPRSTPAPAKE